MFLKAGVDPNAATEAAATYNRVGLAHRFIGLIVDVNAPGVTKFGQTASEGVAEHGHINLVEAVGKDDDEGDD
ncbi:hypothetical protein ANO14919_044000 [Xylariales sp. No.14919]|nr:hypothetical protein ANO14919_044000 [Xylariales sp. No.14919]